MMEGNTRTALEIQQRYTTPLPSRREFLRVVFRQRRKVLGFFTATVLITLLALLIVSPVYVSEAKLLIKVGRESVSVDPSVLGPTMNVLQERRNEINSEIGILTSPYLIERVVKDIGIDAFVDMDEFADEAPARAYEVAVGDFQRDFEASSSGDDDIIHLGYRAASPELAQQALDRLIEQYIDRRIEIHSTQASPAFFREHSTDLLGKLTLAENELESFRTRQQISSIDVQKEALISQVSGLDMAINEFNGQVDASNARIIALQASIESRPAIREINRTTGITNNAADQIKGKLIDLRMREADLSARYPDDERAIVDVRQQILVAEQELAKEEETHTEVTTGVDNTADALRLDLVTERSQLYAAMARLRTLQQERQVKQAQLDRLAGDEIELNRLEREVDIADQEYREYMSRHQRANISAAMDSSRVSNVSVVQPASFISKPVAPRRKLSMLLAILAGIFGGLGIAFLSEYLDSSIKTRDDVSRRLGLPVLMTLTDSEFQSCT
jgi:uncharacterized protein involved in exopolysaccharide biosynthesis